VPEIQISITNGWLKTSNWNRNWEKVKETQIRTFKTSIGFCMNDIYLVHHQDLLDQRKEASIEIRTTTHNQQMNNRKQGNEIEGKRNNNGNRSVNYKLGKLAYGNRRKTSLAIRVYELVDWRYWLRVKIDRRWRIWLEIGRRWRIWSEIDWRWRLRSEMMNLISDESRRRRRWETESNVLWRSVNINI